MAKIADMKRRGRSWLTSLVLIALGVGVGQLVPHRSVTPATVTGMVTSVSPLPGSAGSKLQFTPAGGTRQSYQVPAPTPWRSTASGAWHSSGRPTCLVPHSSKPRKITLGVVTVQSSGPVRGGPLVVWVQCQG